MTSPIQLYKQAYSGLSRNSWFLSSVMLVNRAGTMVIPFMTIYCVRQLHFSITEAGYIMGVFGVGAISGSFIGGKLTDKFGFYDLQIVALMSGGILFMLLGFLHTFTTLAIGTFILSFCNESFRPANSTAIAYYSSDENRTRSYSLNRLAINLGWAFGSGIGGFLASINYHLLFWVDGGTNILAATLLLYLIPCAGIVRPSKQTAIKQKTRSAYADKVYLFFIAMMILFSICFFQLFVIQPVFYKTQWHFNERLIGALMAANGIIIALVEMVITHRLEGSRHPLIYICSGVVLTGMGFLLLDIMPAAIYSGILVVVFITFGEMLAMPFMNSFWTSRTSPHNRGEYAALYSMAWSVAQIVAPTVGSQIIINGSYSLLWQILGSVCMLSAVGFMLLYRFRFSSKYQPAEI